MSQFMEFVIANRPDDAQVLGWSVVIATILIGRFISAGKEHSHEHDGEDETAGEG